MGTMKAGILAGNTHLGALPTVKATKARPLARPPFFLVRWRRVQRKRKEEPIMSIAGTVQHLNRELARRINEEARSNSQSPYANKFVGIANGQVVAVADDLDEMTRQLRQVEADPRKCFWVEASRDYKEVHEIWGLN